MTKLFPLETENGENFYIEFSKNIELSSFLHLQFDIQSHFLTFFIFFCYLYIIKRNKKKSSPLGGVIGDTL